MHKYGRHCFVPIGTQVGIRYRSEHLTTMRGPVAFAVRGFLIPFTSSLRLPLGSFAGWRSPSAARRSSHGNRLYVGDHGSRKDSYQRDEEYDGFYSNSICRVWDRKRHSGKGIRCLTF